MRCIWGGGDKSVVCIGRFGSVLAFLDSGWHAWHSFFISCSRYGWMELSVQWGEERKGEGEKRGGDGRCFCVSFAFFFTLLCETTTGN